MLDGDAATKDFVLVKVKKNVIAFIRFITADSQTERTNYLSQRWWGWGWWNIGNGQPSSELRTAVKKMKVQFQLDRKFYELIISI